MIQADGPWWDFEECGWCHKRCDGAVLYRSVEAGSSWSSVWFVCADCALDAPALINQAGTVQSLKIEAVWFWWHSPRSESGPGPGHSFNTLWPIERKWVRWLENVGGDADWAWGVLREGFRVGLTRLS